MFLYQEGHGQREILAYQIETPDAIVVDWDDGGSTTFPFIWRLKSTGIILIEGLAANDQSGERFGDLIGFKRQSNFAVMFEVIPGYQFLHCRHNTVTGGASLFADGFRICADFRREAPEQFELLSTVYVPWRFHDSDDDIRYRRPIIGLGPNGAMQTLAFNAHIADVPDFPSDQLAEFYGAYRAFMRRIRSAGYSLSYTLQAGEMVVFDNRRVLHGREGFVPGSGERHLRGYYIEHNEVDSRIRVLSR